MLELKLIHVSKRGPKAIKYVLCDIWPGQRIIRGFQMSLPNSECVVMNIAHLPSSRMSQSCERYVKLLQSSYYGVNRSCGLLWSLQWRHNEHDGISNHWRLDCLLSRLFGWRSKKNQRSVSLAFFQGNSPLVNFPHKGPVMWKMFPFDYVIMC